jgi:hypothetical protein
LTPQFLYLQENVDLMSKYIPLTKFKAIHVVDLCHSLCEQAKVKAKAKGWKNVHVHEHDACTFTPPEGYATLVTFSYSLSSAPRARHALRHACAPSTCCVVPSCRLCFWPVMHLDCQKVGPLAACSVPHMR